MAIKRNSHTVDPTATPEETSTSSKASLIDNILRPKFLKDYIGQEQIKSNIEIFIQASQKRNETLEHFLLYGPPGLGKTTLANIIANEMGVNIKITSGPAIEKQGDLASILSGLKKGDILFIDEIHRLKTNIEEILYSAMEDYALDIILGKGPGTRSMRLKIPQFTLIGATTKVGNLSSPLRDRFGNIMKLNFYSVSEMEEIISRSAKILKCSIDKGSIHIIAKSSRYTPRISNRILKQVRDFAEVKFDGNITEDITLSAMKSLGVDENGIDSTDKDILKTIIQKFGGGPVGLSTLAAATAEEKETIEDVYEPYLLQIGFLERSPRGRKVTQKAYEYFGISTKGQKSMF